MYRCYTPLRGACEVSDRAWCQGLFPALIAWPTMPRMALRKDGHAFRADCVETEVWAEIDRLRSRERPE